MEKQKPSEQNKQEFKFPSIFKYAKRIVLPFFFGTGVNIIYSFVFLGAWLKGATLSTSPYAIPAFFVFLLFFPFLYLWYARSFAIREGVSFLYNSSHPITSKALDFMVSSMIVKEESEKKEGLISDASQMAGSFFNTISTKTPWPIKKALAFILSKVPLTALIQEVKNDLAFNQENKSEIQSKVRLKVNNYIQEELIDNSLLWFWILLIINVIAIVLAWMYIA